MPFRPSEIGDLLANEDDFGHEMRVGSVIRSSQFGEVQHGGTYTDSVTHKPRQFDYRCSIIKEMHMLSLAVECKNLSPSGALIVCGTRRSEAEAFHDLIISEVMGYRSSRRAEPDHAFYVPNGFVGKSTVRIQTDKNQLVKKPDEDIYDRWAQALSSAVELVELACHCFGHYYPSPQFLTAVLPVLVVPDDRLWKVIYDETGSISGYPELVNECEFFIGRTIKVVFPQMSQPFTFSHVHFFTLSGLRAFLSKMTVNDYSWNELFTKQSI